jgi:hypothetical protein
LSRQRELGGGSGVDMPQRRRDLLRKLFAVREVAFSKYDNPRTKNSER